MKRLKHTGEKNSYIPAPFPEGLDLKDKAALAIINRWALAWYAWGIDVSNATGHGGGNAGREGGGVLPGVQSASHIVGEPPHPPFDDGT